MIIVKRHQNMILRMSRSLNLNHFPNIWKLNAMLIYKLVGNGRFGGDRQNISTIIVSAAARKRLPDDQILLVPEDIEQAESIEAMAVKQNATKARPRESGIFRPCL
jgi:hypothetical protein